MRRYQRVIVPELNLGQLALILRARYLVDVVSHPKVKGKPFQERELVALIERECDPISPEQLIKRGATE